MFYGTIWIGTPIFVISGGLHFLDIIVLLSIYLYLAKGEIPASIFAFFQGLFLDIYSGGIFGIFSFLYITTLLIVLFFTNLIDMHTKVGLMLTVFLALVFKYLIFLSITFIATKHIPFPEAKHLILYFLATSLLSPTIFEILDKIRIC